LDETQLLIFLVFLFFFLSCGRRKRRVEERGTGAGERGFLARTAGDGS